MIYGAKAYAQVGLETGINSASPHGLIVMLYDGAIEAIRKTKIYLDMGDIEMKTKSVDKALRIIKDGLTTSLDVNAGGALAQQLLALYDYICKELILANAQNSPERMDTCIGLLADLRSAWLEIGQNTANQ
ncbi:MAG: flagellar export chaperone FliS [Gammaproteobacteria bacterium]|nr:flagellar export chaperone FliS [Gammaproteobacteria bacterium]MBU0848337.1 flagellar export chaperone FliS [Gammaproteobacteria bacterium]MBU1267030.1 flagellar export chaperone FliS [Gammaproteobacteria bacterium]MBU1529529.1 flagellar export chaperone FliS [Gammaproteobacteria bacterium]MBU1781110.1 flagellar export chaperone FliS [Gammaproteobacteria bacterium]